MPPLPLENAGPDLHGKGLMHDFRKARADRGYRCHLRRASYQTPKEEESQPKQRTAGLKAAIRKELLPNPSSKKTDLDRGLTTIAPSAARKPGAARFPLRTSLRLLLALLLCLLLLFCSVLLCALLLVLLALVSHCLPPLSAGASTLASQAHEDPWPARHAETGQPWSIPQ